jgi:adenine/guanine phosphoribosyltransferase-like PRPP-binding protein
VSVVVGAFEDAASAVEALAQAGGKRPAAVLPRGAVDDEARLRLRQAQVECLTTLDGGDMDAARWLAATLAQAQGWESADPRGAPAGASASAPGDVIGWCELRIGSGALTTDRPITRLHGAQQYIASFNLLGQGRLNQACGDLLYRRLMDEGVALDEVFDVVVCSESKAVGMVQVVAECFGQDRYVVLRKGLKNYMPRRPREPLVEEAVSITTAGRQALVLDPLDWPLLEGRRVLLVDDVIATGGTARAASRLLERAGARVTAAATVLLNGPEPDLPRLVVLARPLL